MNSRSLETFSNTHFHSLNTRCRRGGDCGRPGQGFWRPFRRKSKTSLVSDATTDDQSSDDIIGDPSESDGIAVTWVKRIGGRRYANEDTTVFDSLWVGKGKASGIKPRKKRKNSEPKESPPYRHHSILHPPAQLSRSPPSPAIPFFVVSWRIQPPVHPLQSHTPQLYLLYPPHPTGHTAWSITSTISPFQIPPIYYQVHLPALPRSSQGTSQLGTFDR